MTVRMDNLLAVFTDFELARALGSTLSHGWLRIGLENAAVRDGNHN